MPKTLKQVNEERRKQEENGKYVTYDGNRGRTIAKPDIKHKDHNARQYAIHLRELLLNKDFKIKVSYLKDSLTAFGELTSGNKRDLVKRVLPHINTYFEESKKLDVDKVLSSFPKKAKKKNTAWIIVDTHTEASIVGVFETNEEAITEYAAYIFKRRKNLVKEVGKKFEQEFGTKLTKDKLIKVLLVDGEKRDFLNDELVFFITKAKIGELFDFSDLRLSGDRELYDLLDMILKGNFGKLWG